MRAVFLTGEHVYLRAMVAADKECAAAWFDSPFPINASRAEAFLKEEHKQVWGARRSHYAIVRVADDAVIGGATVRSNNGRTAWLALHLAPWLPDADARRADALRLLVPWLRDEHEFMTVTVPIAADEPATLAVAEALGLVAGARLRERLARPGRRVDQFLYQALNPRWEVDDA